MDTEAPILIVSDVHLGSKMSHAKALSDFLASTKWNTLILNGDILDSANMKFLKPEHWKFVAELEKFAKEGRNILWIAGNHDTFARPFFKSLGIPTKTQHMFEWNGKQCLVIHGHQFDRFLIKNEAVSKAMNRSYRFIQAIDGKRQVVSRFAKKRYKVWLRVSKRVAKGAVKHAAVKHASYVFCGHTHETMTLKLGNVTYMNCGSWADKPCHYILLEANQREAKIGTVQV